MESIPLQAAEQVSAAVNFLLRVDDGFAWADDNTERAQLRATYSEALAALQDMQAALGVEDDP